MTITRSGICRGLLLTSMLVLAGTVTEARAATFVVDSVSDDAGLTACTSAPADCSLRGALVNANGAGGSNVITFDAAVFNPGTITLTSTLPTITGTLSIDGPGASLVTVEGAAGFGLMAAGTGADLTIRGMTFANANAIASGGALSVTAATLTVTRSVFSNNATSGAFGGAVYIESGSVASFSDTTFSGNAAFGRGGAIYLTGSSTLALSDCTLTGNHTDTSGASAGLGGALNIETSTSATITNSTLTGNAAVFGGGLHLRGSVTVTNSTIAGNTATSGGGGVYNRGVTLELNNSIISGNAQSGGSSQCENVNTGSITNARNSLIEDNLTCVDGINDNNLTGDPMLGALADNGGPTLTMALHPGSPAIDAGADALAVDENSAPLPIDQRGYTRIIGGAVDMGAVESGSSPNFIVDTTSDADLETCSTAPGDCSLRGAIALANAASQPISISFDATEFASARTITLTASLPTITNASGVNVRGTGPSLLSIDGAGSYRVFAVGGGADVALENLTIAHGHANKGGGINSSGTLAVSNVVFDANVATNTAGGGLYVNNGSATVTASTFTANTANGNGGAIDNFGGTLTVINSTFNGNAATSVAAGYGGAIYSSVAGSTTVINSTLDGNGATFGGNLYSIGAFALHNSIVAGSTAGVDCFAPSGTFDLQSSLIEDGTCGASNGTNGNLSGDPLLGVLADNGGVTPTMAVLSGSPAIDAGSNALAVDADSQPLGTDQRGPGFARIVNSTVDIGAYEYVDAVAPAVTSFSAPSPVNGLSIPITSFTATDNLGVSGYLITESSTPPAPDDPGWSGSAPSTYTVAGDGSYTLYPWARDAVGNVSAVYDPPASVIVDTTAPTVTGFAADSPTNSLTIVITTFTATDANGVTGYRVTESATPPAAGDPGWSPTAPATYGVAAEGPYTLYPWARDIAGNVSAVSASPASVVVDTTPPSVVITSTAGTPTAASPIPVSITFSEPVVGLTPGDIVVGNGSIGSLSGGGNSYTVDVTPAASGTVTVDVAASVANDPAGNGNTAATTFSIAYDADLQAGPNFSVNSLADTDDGYCDVPGQGLGNADCTLREAIDAANADIDASIVSVLVDATITLDGGQLPAITTDVTIIGNGQANTVIEASDCDPITPPSCTPAAWGVFYVDNSGQLTVHGVTIRNGNAPMDGGAVENYGALTLSDVALRRNVAAESGGGVANFGTATLMDVTINENLSFTGGGFYNFLAATAVLDGVTFANNITSGIGAGIYLGGGGVDAVLTNVTFNANSALAGGGIYVSRSRPVLINVTLSGNTAASGSGGGLYNSGSMANPGRPKLVNVIIANSVGGGDCVNDGNSSPDAASNHNLIEDSANACGLTDGIDGNLVGADPLLGTLDDNGGLTSTLALLDGSPAIDAGTSADCPATDQRGVMRPFGVTCDIGAYEYVDRIFADGFEASP